jgi:hypothetical protein
MKRVKFTFYCLAVSSLGVYGQTSNTTNEINNNQDTIIVEEEYVEPEEELETFGATRIINGHSVETLHKGVLEFRIEHKFGDLAGAAGGINSLYGLDNVADIRIAFEYGITDKLMIGLGRSRGTGEPYRSLLDGFAKYRILHQDTKKVPLSMSFIGSTSYTYMPKSDVVNAVNNFPKNVYRFAYSSQLNIARKFGKKLSLSLMPTLVYRNYVAQDDVNALFSLGGAVNYAVNSKVGLTVEYYNNFQDNSIRKEYKNSLSFAVEWLTFGHNFKVYLTNAKGFGETQFIPYTSSDWSKGQFRLGFCVGRKYMKE